MVVKHLQSAADSAGGGEGENLFVWFEGLLILAQPEKPVSLLEHHPVGRVGMYARVFTVETQDRGVREPVASLPAGRPLVSQRVSFIQEDKQCFLVVHVR